MAEGDPINCANLISIHRVMRHRRRMPNMASQPASTALQTWSHDIAPNNGTQVSSSAARKVETQGLRQPNKKNATTPNRNQNTALDICLCHV